MIDNSENNIKITALGTGTSTGVPSIGCECETCRSTDWRDKRLRCSLLVESANTSVVIDTSPDFRQQMLRANVKHVDALIFTHHHFDHIGGFDDIRIFNFRSGREMPVYVTEKDLKELRRTFIYAFEKPEQMGGGVPGINPHIIKDEKFTIGDIEFLPIPLKHGKMDTLGFRIGNFAYCTDTNFIPDSSLELLKGLDVLILDALRFKEHPTHYNIDQAVKMAKRIGAGKTYFTHMNHDIKHEECEAELPENICYAYDELEFILENKSAGREISVQS